MKKLKVLFADDSKSLRKNVERILTNDGHQCVLVQNGQEAIDTFKQAFETEKFDLVLLDIQMPIIQGDEALLIIRETDPDVPVIMITSSEDSTLLSKLNKKDRASTLSKISGIKKERLISAIQTIMAENKPS